MNLPIAKPAALAALASVLALAGCITAPAGAPAAAPLAAQQLGLGAAAVPAVDARWWQDFHDPQLDRLMDQALAGNPTLAQALARVREAQALADVAQAGTGPSLGYDFDESRQRLSANFIIPPPYAGSVAWYGSQGLNLSWDLDFWGRQAALLRRAQAQTAALALDAAGARLAISGALLRSYLDLALQYRQAELATTALAQRRELLALIRKRLAAGLDTKLELREAERAVPQAELELQQLRLDQTLTAHRLAALAGLGADAYAQITQPALDLDALPPLPEQLPADLLARRPDVLAARARIDAATAGRDAAKAAFYPDINLVAFAGTSALGLGRLFQAASGDYGAGPAIHLPIFDAGRLKADYRGAAAEIDAAIAAYDETVLAAVRDTADPLSSLGALREQLATQARSLAAADASLRLTTERRDAGLASTLDVLVAQRPVLAARSQRLALSVAQARNRVALLLAVGGSFEPGAPENAQAAQAADAAVAAR